MSGGAWHIRDIVIKLDRDIHKSAFHRVLYALHDDLRMPLQDHIRGFLCST